MVYKALYGLSSFGFRRHGRLTEIRRSLGFYSSETDADIWMRKNDDIYRFNAVYVGDVAITVKNPEVNIEQKES